MAAGRQRVEWSTAYAVASWVCRSMVGQAPTAEEFMPPGLFDSPKARKPLTPEEQAKADAHSFDSFMLAFESIYMR